MSVPNAGQAASAVLAKAENPKNYDDGEVDDVKKDVVEDGITVSVKPVAPDQFDPRYETGKWERWAFYAYYCGNNGLSLFNFGPTAAQNALYEAGGDSGLLVFFGKERTVESIVLLCNGIAFAIQCVLFLILGSLADYGRWRPYILIFWSIVAFAVGFAWMAVHTPERWPAGLALYMIGLIAYQMCFTFWFAAFPGLARNTPELREAAEKYEAGDITRDDYDTEDMLQRNRFSNMGFIAQSAVEIVILAILVGILFALRVNDSTANNDYGLSVLVAYTTGCWVVLAIPWFFLEKKRPGRQMPPGMNLITVTFYTLWRAMVEIWRMKQSFIYLVGYFILGDSLNTTVTVIATLQNSIVSYNTLTLTYLYIVGITTQLIGIGGFWYVQKRWRLSTKTMFNAIMLGILFLDAWGMVGIWTNKLGFKHVWEVWMYQVIYGLWVCPWYSYSQTMISEVTPRGREFLFFSLFSVMGKTSAFIGPLVSSAIIDASPSKNNSLPFYFLFGLTFVAMALLMWKVDLKKSRQEQEAFLIAEKEKLDAMR